MVGGFRFAVVLWILGLPFVFDVGDVSVIISLVSDDLSSAIGQRDTVRSGHCFRVCRLLMGVVVVARAVADSVAETVRHQRLVFGNTIRIIIFITGKRSDFYYLITLSGVWFRGSRGVTGRFR